MKSTYSKYKDSGIEWLGEIPEMWKVRKLKFNVDLITEKINQEETSFPYLGLEHIQSWTGKYFLEKESKCEGEACRFIPNDILFGKLRPYLAKVILAKHEGIATSEALNLRPLKITDSTFLKYYLLSRDFINIVNGSTFGSKMPRASWEFISNLPFLQPTLCEQRRIAEFLDKKTEQIDLLIKKKKELRKKLKEQRISLITNAVTGKINIRTKDTKIKYKDSGIEWLGEIPEHWEVRKLKFNVNLIVEKINQKETSLSYLGLEHIQSWTGKYYLDKESKCEGDACRFIPNDVLFGKLRPYLAKVMLSKHEGIATSEVLNLRALKITDSTFLKYYLLSRDFINIVNGSTFGSKMPRASWEFISNLPFLQPPLCEQRKIAEYLDEKTERIDILTKKIDEAIKKLEEYRIALITEAVTGKIKVV